MNDLRLPAFCGLLGLGSLSFLSGNAVGASSFAPASGKRGFFILSRSTQAHRRARSPVRSTVLLHASVPRRSRSPRAGVFFRARSTAPVSPGPVTVRPVPGGTRSPGPGRPVRAAPVLARPAPRPPCERVRGPSGAVPGPCSPGPVAACVHPPPAYDALPGRSLRPIARRVAAPCRGRARTGSRAVIHPRGTARFRRALTREPQESSGRLTGGESGRRGRAGDPPSRWPAGMAGRIGGPFRACAGGYLDRIGGDLGPARRMSSYGLRTRHPRCTGEGRPGPARSSVRRRSVLICPRRSGDLRPLHRDPLNIVRLRRIGNTSRPNGSWIEGERPALGERLCYRACQRQEARFAEPGLACGMTGPD